MVRVSGSPEVHAQSRDRNGRGRWARADGAGRNAAGVFARHANTEAYKPMSTAVCYRDEMAQGIE